LTTDNILVSTVPTWEQNQTWKTVKRGGNSNLNDQSNLEQHVRIA